MNVRQLFSSYPKARRWYRFISVFLLIALCFWLNLQCLSYTLCEISGTSMQHTLQHGQIVVVQTTVRTLNRGDVVVFDAGKEDHIKRIIGMGGDTIRVTRSGTDLSMAIKNGDEFVTIVEDYIKDGQFKWSMMSLKQNLEYPKSTAVRDNEDALVDGWNGLTHGSSVTFTVPEGYFFVLGDNRGVSEDSRAHGYVSSSAVVSKVIEMRKAGTATLNLFGRKVQVQVDYVKNFKILRFIGLLAGYLGFAAIFMAGSPLFFDGGRQPYGKN